MSLDSDICLKVGTTSLKTTKHLQLTNTTHIMQPIHLRLTDTSMLERSEQYANNISYLCFHVRHYQLSF